MKKLFFFAATATLLGSCSSNEVFQDETAQNAIHFTMYSSQSTNPYQKAIDADLATLQQNGFTVSGRLHADGTPYMTEREVKYNNVSWYYTPIQYWPATGSLDFLAIANNATATANFLGTNENPTVSFTAEVEPTKQADLLIASSFNVSKTTSNNSVTGQVLMSFKHALSHISVEATAKFSDESVYLKVLSIEFHDIHNGGVCTIDKSNSSLSWEANGTTATNSLGLADITIPGNVNHVTSSGLTTAEGALLIVPQPQTSFTIKYQWLQGNFVIEDYSQEGKTVTLTNSWEPSKKYKYTLNIEPGVVPISFDANVENWTEVGSTVNIQG